MKRKDFIHVLRKLKRTTFALTIALAFVLACVLTADADGAMVQVKNENTYETNVVQFSRVEYVGQCPGISYSPDKIRARFISPSTLPAPKRRVTLKNVTEGMNSDPYPYTDREYSKGQYSEGFDFSFGDKHKGRTFSVLRGENKFEYAIREGEAILEQGTFTADVSVKDLGVFKRGVICSDREICHDETDDDDRDRHGHKRNHTRRICHTVNECKCP